MKKQFKKIYVEITNRCNLNCSFCGKNKRAFRDMTIEEFRSVIEKIKDYTDYIYLHVKGEPLLRDDLDSFLAICEEHSILVNITTNGVLLKRRFDVLNRHSCVRQVNVSLHSLPPYENYFEDVFTTCKKLSTHMFISYRIWNLQELMLDPKSQYIVDKIADFYSLSTDIVEKINIQQQIKIDFHTYVNKDNLFVWPDVDNKIDCVGHCYGLSTHIGILADGTVVPCCLDGNGEIPLGNIYTDTLEDVIHSECFVKMKEGFLQNRCEYELCKHCNFKSRFHK